MEATKPTHAEHPLPDSWRRVLLGDVAVINPKRPKLNVDAAEQVTFVPMAAVSEDFSGIKDSYARPYSEVSQGYTYFEEDDLLFSKITPCLQNGKHATARNLINGFGFGSTEFHIVRAADSTNAGFLFRALTRPEVIKECADSFTGTAGQQRVQPDTLRSLPILLPPLPEQRAIATVLDSIDDAIEGAEAVIAATEGLRDALLQDLLTCGLPGQHTEFRDVPRLGTIPADWEVVRLGDVVPKFEYGTSTKCSSEPAGMPILRIPNIASGSLNLSDLKYAHLGPKESTSIQLATGDILLVRTNGNPDICGQCWVSEGLEGNWGFASYLVRGRADISRMNPWFAGHFLRSGVGRRLLKGNIRTSAGNYNLSVASLGSMLLPCPPLNEQDLIVGTIRGLTRSIELAGQETTGLRLLKDSTAAALLTGNLRTQALSM